MRDSRISLYILPGNAQAAHALHAHPIPVNNRKITDQTGCDVETFLVNTLRQNHRDRLTIYTLEKDMIGFCSNPAIYSALESICPICEKSVSKSVNLKFKNQRKKVIKEPKFCNFV